MKCPKHALYLFIAALLAFSTASCSKPAQQQNVTSSFRPWRTDIQLDDAVVDQGCLNVPKLFSAMQAIDPRLPVITVPRAISFQSNRTIRDNFRKLVAYGQLIPTLQPFEEIQSLPNVTQDTCKQLQVFGINKVEKNYRIKQATGDSVIAEAADGEEIEYQWVGPRTILSRRRYTAYDVPCGSERHPIFVTITKVFDWNSAEIPQSVPETGSALSIDASFLALVAEAVGEDPANLYIPTASGRDLSLPKVIEMAQLPPRPETISCDGTAPPEPEPEPEPDPVPDPGPIEIPEEDNSPGLDL